jgi:hypothetical protein
MKKTIQSLSAMLAMLALVCVSLTLTTSCGVDNQEFIPPIR